MGCHSPNHRKEEKINEIISSYCEEKELVDHPQSLNKDDFKKIVQQMEGSVCKIKCINGSTGTGFFCKIPFPNDSCLLPVLITNYHVLEEKDITIGKTINISLDNDKYKYEIKKDDIGFTYSDSKYDVTILEIKNVDKLENVSFLKIEDNILNSTEYKEFNNTSIYLLHYPHGIKIECSVGVLKRIDEEYDMKHLCKTQTGSSGSPILSLSTYKVIGIHKGGAKTNRNYNRGTVIKGPIENFYQKIQSLNQEKKIIKEEITQNNAFNSSLMNIIYNQVKYSVCKIYLDNRKGCGFFCKIPIYKEKSLLPVLITNNHILDEKNIMPGKVINYSFYYNNNIKRSLKIDNSRKTITDKHLDFTAIEIKSTDEFDFNSFLEIDDIDDTIYSKSSIELYILYYDRTFSIGRLINVNKDIIIFNISTNTGSSGCPILNSSNNKLLGISQGSNGKGAQCIGTYIEYIIEIINKYHF